MRAFLSRKTLILCISIAVIAKVFAMAVSAHSYEFLYMVKEITALPGKDIRLKAYWIYLLNGLYRFWLSLPVEHTGLKDWLGLKPFPIRFGDLLLVSILKLPILALDLACGYIIYKIVHLEWGRYPARMAFTLWICNPLVTLTAEMSGSNDILIAVLAVASVYLLMRRNTNLSGLALAAGAAAKLYAVLLTPMLALFSSRRNATKIVLASISGAAIYFFWVIKSGLHPFFTLMNYTPLTFAASEMLLTPYDSRIGLATFSSLVYFYLTYRFWQRGEGLLDAILGLTLIYMAFLNWWPPYLLLLLPFITLELSKKGRGKPHVILILIFIFLYMLCHADSFGLSTRNAFFYIWNYHDWMKGASEILKRFSTDVVVKLVIEPVTRSVYAGLSILYSIRLLLWNSPQLKAAIIDRFKIKSF